MRIRLFIYITLTLNLLGLTSRSQPQFLTVYNYSVSDGLPSSEIYEVYQDRNGFLWFATDNGVVRYDGSNMQKFHIKDGLTDPVVFGFYEDKKNRIWFRTFSGKLSYYENGNIKKYAFNNVISKFYRTGYLRFVVRDNDAIDFTVWNLRGTIDATGAIATSPLEHEGLHSFKIDNDHLLGISTDGEPVTRLFVDNKAFQLEVTRESIQNRVYQAVTWRGKTYLSVGVDIFAYDGSDVTKAAVFEDPVISLSVDTNDHLWVGTLNGGVRRFTGSDFKSSWSPEFVKDKSVTKVIRDHEGGFWFTTLESGAYYVPTLTLPHRSLLTSSKPKAFASTTNAVVIGDQLGNIYSLDKQTQKESLKLALDAPTTAIFQDRKGRLFVSTNSSVRIFNEKFHLQSQHEAIGLHMAEDSEGTIWMFGGNRLRRFMTDGSIFVSTGLDVPYRTFAIDEQKAVLYMAERTGLHIRDMNLNILSRPKDFSEYKISGITNFNDSTILLSTIGSGFMVVNKKTFQSRIYNTQTNFIADNIYSSLLDRSTLWLGTEKGLIRIPLESLTSDKLAFKYLTKESGLQSDKIDFITKVNSDVWAFSENTFTIIPGNYEKFANEYPKFYIQHIKVNGKSIHKSQLDKIPYDENNVHITVGFISFNNPNIFLRYRTAKNLPWTYSPERTLLFSALAPGNYTLELEYSTDKNLWTRAPGLNFKILQPWWNQWYTYAALVGIALLLIYVYFRYQRSVYLQKNKYLNIINEHQQKLIQSEIVTLERERNRISIELHDRVGTNLSAIKLAVGRALKSSNESLAFEIEQQFQEAIKEIKDIIYALTPPSLERYGLFSGLKNYVVKLQKELHLNIVLKTFGDETHHYETNIIIFRVIQELITNSIKHANAKQITIHINSFEDLINIVYEDDGVGFNYDPMISGLGLDNIDSRIRALNGTIKFESGDFGVSYAIDIPVSEHMRKEKI